MLLDRGALWLRSAKRRSALGATVLGACLCVGLTAEGATIFVKGDASGANSGTSWADAFKELQSALAVAVSGDQIWVAAGTYKPDYDVNTGAHTLSRTATFQLKDGVALCGGFAGNEDPAGFNLADRDFETNVTILSGDLSGNDGPNFANNAENSYHVVTGSGTASTARLDGVTVTAGNANGGTGYDRGGGVYSSGGSPTFADCVFKANKASVGGGGVAVASASLDSHGPLQA